MHIEVEQKFRVPDPAEFLRRLAAWGGSLGEPEAQSDTYFAHPGRDFAKTDEALRIRHVGDSNAITYKGPKLDATTKSRREIEIPFAPRKATAEQMAELLVALGFRAVAEVCKQRRTAQVAWRQHTVEVALDDVADVGTFVELELSADEAGLETAKETIASLAAALGLADSERRSYLEMLLAQQTGTG